MGILFLIGSNLLSIFAMAFFERLLRMRVEYVDSSKLNHHPHPEEGWTFLNVQPVAKDR
jgi:hypothetical protein